MQSNDSQQDLIIDFDSLTVDLDGDCCGENAKKKESKCKKTVFLGKLDGAKKKITKKTAKNTSESEIIMVQ